MPQSQIAQFSAASMTARSPWREYTIGAAAHADGRPTAGRRSCGAAYPTIAETTIHERLSSRAPHA